MSQELADRLAVAAGWRPHQIAVNEPGWFNPSANTRSYDHPFPVGRIDPILDLMRERGLAVDFMHTRDGLSRCGLTTQPRTTRSRFYEGEGPGLWTALASAVLAAMEKHNGK